MPHDPSRMRALIEAVAADAGMTVEEVIAEQERSLYTLCRDRLAETARDEARRTQALSAVDEFLESLCRLDRHFDDRQDG